MIKQRYNTETIKDRPNAEISYTKWGLEKDYTRQVLPLQYNAERLRRTHNLLAQGGVTLPLRLACPS
jgi:hypothetical protein